MIHFPDWEVDHGAFNLSDFECRCSSRCCRSRFAAFRVSMTAECEQDLLAVADGAPRGGILVRYGPHTCTNRFNRWRKACHWARILQAL